MKVRDLFSGPEKWTKGEWARDKEGRPTCSNAFCWCLIGAIFHCYKDEDYPEICEKIDNEGIDNLMQWNDAPERKFEEVKELVERLDI